MKELSEYAEYLLQKYSNERYTNCLDTAKAQLLLGISTCIMNHKCNASMKDRLAITNFVSSKLKGVYQI